MAGFWPLAKTRKAKAGTAKRERVREDASTHTLGAVVTAIIMLSGVAYVVTFENADPRPDKEREDAYEIRASNVLDLLHDWPLAAGNCAGARQEDQVVVESLIDEGDSPTFRRHAENVLGEHAQADLWLRSPEGRIPLVTEIREDEYGYGVSRSYDPDWQAHITSPSLSAVTGVERLTIQTVGQFDSKLTHTKGDAVRTRIWMDNGKIVETWSLFGLLPLRHEARPHAESIVWKTLVEDAFIEHIEPGEGRREFEFLLDVAPPADGGTPIPANTRVTISFPPGWNATREEPDDWLVDAYDPDVPRRVVNLTLPENRTTSSTFRIFARAPELPPRAYDVITARLSAGGLGESKLVVTYPEAAEKGMPMRAFATTPYPLRHGSEAVFGVAFVNSGPQAVNVTRIDVEVPGGYDMDANGGQGVPLFATAPRLADEEDPEAAAQGWTLDETHKLATWIPEGGIDVPAGEARGWKYVVTTTSDLSVETSVEGATSRGVTSRITFENGFVDETASWGQAPGVYLHEVPPDEIATAEADGYPWLTQGAHSYTIEFIGGRAGMTRTGSYTVKADASELARVDGALGNGSARVRDRLVAAGGLLQVDVDLQDVVGELAALGASDLELRVGMRLPAGAECGEVRAWTRPVEQTPHAAITRVQVAPAGGIMGPAVYAMSEDKNVYRLNSLGLVDWSYKLGDRPTTLNVSGAGLDAVAFVGDRGGTVTRLGVTGEPEWNTTLDGPIFDLAAQGDFLLVRTSSNVSILRTSGGAIESQLGVESLAAVWTPAGDIITLEAGRVARYGIALVPLAEHAEMGDVKVAGATTSAIYVTRAVSAESSETLVLDPATLETRASFFHLGQPLLAATGDATGDEIDDYVVAFDSLFVVVVDGVTDLQTSRFVGLPASEGQGIPVDAAQVPPVSRPGTPGVCNPTQGRCDVDQTGSPDVPVAACASTEDCGQYAPCHSAPVTTYSAVSRDETICIAKPTGDALPNATHLGAEAGRVTFIYATADALPRLVHWKHDESEVYEAPAATAADTHVWGTARALVVASNDVATGLGAVLTLSDETSSATTWAAQPTEQTGRFTVLLALPQAVLYGTHMITTTLAWTTEVGGEQVETTATLLDWFEAANANREPAAQPVYLMSLVARDPTMPPGVRTYVGAARVD